MKKFLTILILSTLILCACNFEQDVENKHDRNASTKTTGNEQKKKEVINGRTYYDGILIVNKTTKLPSDYNPGEKPKAQRALQRMFTDAEKDGVSLYKISGFRSYETQVNLYNQYVARDGEQAAIVIVRPGTSEHQSGLSYDVGAIGSLAIYVNSLEKQRKDNGLREMPIVMVLSSVIQKVKNRSQATNMNRGICVT